MVSAVINIFKILQHPLSWSSCYSPSILYEANEVALETGCFTRPTKSLLISSQLTQMSYVSIFAQWNRLWSWCRINIWLAPSMKINIQTLWQSIEYSAGVYRRSSMCVNAWCLGRSYSSSSPKGEGGEVIYTLIMPAPLNTPPDR